MNVTRRAFLLGAAYAAAAIAGAIGGITSNDEGRKCRRPDEDDEPQ